MITIYGPRSEIMVSPYVLCSLASRPTNFMNKPGFQAGATVCRPHPRRIEVWNSRNMQMSFKPGTFSFDNSVKAAMNR